MAYYGSGYSTGIGQNFNAINSSPQAGVIPAGGGFYAPQSSPTADSKALAGSNVQDKINPPALGTLTNGGYAGAIDETSKMAQLPSWASQYIQGNASGNTGNPYSSGQLNDAYYNSAGTLGNIYNQYGSGFDPSKFTGLGDGSLYGLQNSLNGQGYGLDNIGGYYQDKSIQNGAQAGVNYSVDPNYGVVGSIGGLNFDVGSYMGSMSNAPKDYFTNTAKYVTGLGQSSGYGIPGSSFDAWKPYAIGAAGPSPWGYRAGVQAGSGVRMDPNQSSQYLPSGRPEPFNL